MKSRHHALDNTPAENLAAIASQEATYQMTKLGTTLMPDITFRNWLAANLFIHSGLDEIQALNRADTFLRHAEKKEAS